MTKRKSIPLFAATFAMMLLVAGCSQRVPVNDVEINKDYVIETIWAIYPHQLDQAGNGSIEECNKFNTGYAAIDCYNGYTVIIDKSGINAFANIGDKIDRYEIDRYYDNSNPYIKEVINYMTGAETEENTRPILMDLIDSNVVSDIIDTFPYIGSVNIGRRRYTWGFDRNLPIVHNGNGDSYKLNITGRELLPPEYVFDTAPNDTSGLTSAKGINKSME
ncbi:MAG: hypothetical protein FWG88_11035 [Oscillospiraceae bacterium]|nr:hypothetical protein [Oscillospiraceae bacterium]